MAIRCVKAFDLRQMGADKLTKLKNEATIFLSLELSTKQHTPTPTDQPKIERNLLTLGFDVG